MLSGPGTAKFDSAEEGREIQPLATPVSAPTPEETSASQFPWLGGGGGGGGFPLPAEQQEISCAPTGLGRFFMGGGGVLGTKTGRQAVSGTAQALLCLARGPGQPAGREGSGPWLTPGVPGQAAKAKAPAGQRTLPARRAEGRKGQGGAVGADGRTADSPVKRGPLPAWVPCRSKEEAALERPGLPWQCPQGEDAAPTSSWQAGLPFPTCLPPPPAALQAAGLRGYFWQGPTTCKIFLGLQGGCSAPPKGAPAPDTQTRMAPAPPQAVGGSEGGQRRLLPRTGERLW